MRAGDEIPVLEVTPDEALTDRYAAVSGDPNLIHLDADYARAVGLPGRILHGLYTMALLGRVAGFAADDDPRRLRRLSVEFRGMAFPGRQLTVGGTVRERKGDRAVLALTAQQGDTRLVRNAVAEVE